MGILIRFAACVLLLNFAWEQVHSMLYVGFEEPGSCMLMCTYATVWDVLLSFFALAATHLINGEHLDGRFSWRSYLGIVVIAAGIAIFIEQRALLEGKWAYTPAMPVLPVLNIGLTPFVQLPVLAAVSAYLARRLSRTRLLT